MSASFTIGCTGVIWLVTRTHCADIWDVEKRFLYNLDIKMDSGLRSLQYLPLE